MSIVWLYAVCPVIGYFTYQYSVASYGPLRALVLSIVVAYLPTYPITDHLSKHGGLKSKWVQTFPAFCQHFQKLLNGSVSLEAELDHEKPYIFGSFPHGTCSVNHVLTMTDACGMLTKHHKGDRRDLAASVLFLIPIVKEILLLLGCVDASSATCHYNLKRGRSILVFVGGEKEQLLTEPGSHKIYLLNRKGFVKLALQYGCDLVPMYAFGENEAYETSHFLADFRNWLQHKFKLGIPIFFGRHGMPFSLMPKKVSVGVEVGKPIPVRKLEKAQITDKDIDALHAQFVLEMRRLFERTKARHGVDEKTVLQIL